MIRKLFKQYFGKHYDEAEYQYNEHGKPFLEGVSFNISHSDNLCVCAIADKNIELGVDTECKDRRVNWRKISKNVLSEKELSYINDIPNDTDQLDAFVKLWTKKEAISKAIGKGLAIPFRNISLEEEENVAQKWMTYTFLLKQ
jgi:4'-phosphopantetheinyl transferase